MLQASSSSSSSSSSDPIDLTKEPFPLFSGNPVKYVKIFAGKGDQVQVFLMNIEAAQFSNGMKDLLSLSQQYDDLSKETSSSSSSSSSSSTLGDDNEKDEEEMPELYFEEIPGPAMRVVVEFLLYKLRFSKVRLTRIPEFPLGHLPKPTGLHVLIAANQLCC